MEKAGLVRDVPGSPDRDGSDLNRVYTARDNQLPDKVSSPQVAGAVSRITGIVESGRQKAAFFTSLPWVREQCRKQLGFSPHPGTLNLRLDSTSLAEWQKIPSTGRARLIPPEDDYCTAELQPVDIQGISGAVIILPKEYNIHDDRVIEVLAPCNLKEALGLRDSDPLTLVLK